MTTRPESRLAKAAVGLAAIIALVAIVIVVFGLFNSPYTVNARFQNAGQLVTGGEVQLAGRQVGSIQAISLAGNGLANVNLSVDDSSLVPLHEGTEAAIRAVSQSSSASRYVELLPGPTNAPPLKSGAVLPVTRTMGIVDLDEVLNAFGPPQRQAFQQLIAHSGQVFAGSGSTYFNSMLGRLDPALGEVQGVSGQLAADGASLGQLIHTAAVASQTLDARRDDLQGSVVNSARALTAIATERTALADTLSRAPRVLDQAGGTLARTAQAVTTARATLREVPAVGAPLSAFLGRVNIALTRLGPAVQELNGELPGLRRTLSGLSVISPPAVSALRAIAPALVGLMPMLAGVRYYAPDFLLGVTNGLAGLLASNYNSAGHYARLTFILNPQTIVSGALAGLLSQFQLVPGLFNIRTRLFAPCPGSGEPPAPDGSNPWIPVKGLCNPNDGVPLGVDFP
jgi:phospholipid/cholesterol/gamma-HCH transport system substrate-binding protein